MLLGVQSKDDDNMKISIMIVKSDALCSCGQPATHMTFERKTRELDPNMVLPGTSTKIVEDSWIPQCVDCMNGAYEGE